MWFFLWLGLSLTSQNIPQAKSFATAIVNSGSAVGSGLGMILSSYLVAQKGLPWQVMMYISAFMIICMLVVFQVIIRNHKEDMALIQPTVVEKDNGAVKKKVPFKTVCATYAICVYFIFWHLLCILYDCDLVT